IAFTNLDFRGALQAWNEAGEGILRALTAPLTAIQEFRRDLAASNEAAAAETAELTTQLGELEEQLSGAGGAGGVAGAADEAADAIQRMLEQARRENQQLLALRAAHQGYGSTVESVNIAIAIDNQLRAAKITRLQAEKAGLLEVMVANERLRRE